MRFDDTKAKALAASQITAFVELADEANLSGKSQGCIVGISRSRWTQLCANPSKSVLQTHLTLNLLWGITAIKRGLAEGWLPAKGERGAAQDTALENLRRLAAE